MLQRAYACLDIKSFDDDERIIRGTATTPAVDRVGDIIEPLGVKFKNPAPLLHQHRSDAPVGTVKFDKPTAKGVTFEARIPKIDEPGPLKDRVDTAWGEVKAGLVRAVSVGFRALDDGVEQMKNGGLRFTGIEVLELSLVTIPANYQATIDTIKQFDTDAPAATGTVLRVTKSPGASGPVKVIHSRSGAGKMKQTIGEQIKDYEATRAAKSARMDELMTKAAETGTTLDQAQEEEYDGLEADVAGVDKHLVRLRGQEERNKAAAVAVDATTTTKAAADTRGGIAIIREEKLEPGIEFARFAMCLAAAKGNTSEALALAQTHYPQQTRGIEVLKAVTRRGGSMTKFIDSAIRTKADVAGASTTDSAWAGTLLAYNTYTQDFIEYLRNKTIVGQFGQNGIPDFRRIPFNVHIKGMNAGGTGYWVGEGKAKPVTKFGFNDVYHGFHKVAAISVLDDEIIRFSDPSAERLVRDGLADVGIERIDTTFIDPNVAAVANVSPASIINGIASIASSGDTADDVRQDIGLLWAPALAANLPLTGAVYITTPSIALHLSLMMNTLGQREFPGMSMSGGTLLGVPVIVSNHVNAGVFVLAFASEIFYSDDGQATIDASKEATIEMTDAPAGDSVTPTAMASHFVSMYQSDSVALRMHRYVTWSLRRTTAVRWLHAVSWGGAAS